MVYPIPGLPVTTPYGVAGNRWKAGHHQGVDFPTPVGTPYAAVADGVVIATGNAWGANLGQNQVVIDHVIDGQDYYTVYAHGNSETVDVGDTVRAGQIIGTTGAQGNVTGPHLHIEAHTSPEWDTTTDVNPQPLLDYNETMSSNQQPAPGRSGHAIHTAGYTLPTYSNQTGTVQAQNILGISNPLAGTERLLRIVTDGQFWVRVLEIALGSFLIIYGVTSLAGSNISNLPGVSALASKVI